MYSRPQKSDLDAWNIPGWSYDELLPYMKKLETFHRTDPNARLEHHGTSGPIHISQGTYRSDRVTNAFLDAASSLNIPISPDLSDPETPIGAQSALRFISPDGARQDTFSRYVLPLLSTRPNLHVLHSHRVQRILFSPDNTRATGVELDTGATISTKKMVVSSAGAIGTPLLLQRSGIGKPPILSSAGISLIQSLPVGEAYQDHDLFFVPYYSDLQPNETLDSFSTGRSGPAAEHLGWNAQDVTAKLRPAPSELGPFQSIWHDFASKPDKPLGLMSLVVVNPLPDAPEESYFSLSAFTAHPYGRGHVYLTSSGMDFDAGILGDRVDLEMSKWLYKKQRAIARRMECYRGEYGAGHPPFEEGSEAWCGRQEGPVMEEIKYSEEDDRVLETWLRGNVGTTWHSLGTCRMGGVVDERLRVMGIEGLRVADLSVAPGNVGANTGVTAMVIGERAAGLFGQELGLETGV